MATQERPLTRAMPRPLPMQQASRCRMMSAATASSDNINLKSGLYAAKSPPKERIPHHFAFSRNRRRESMELALGKPLWPECATLLGRPVQKRVAFMEQNATMRMDLLMEAAGMKNQRSRLTLQSRERERTPTVYLRHAESRGQTPLAPRVMRVTSQATSTGLGRCGRLSNVYTLNA